MTLAPAMRLGWIVPPPQLLRAIAETKRDDDFGTPVMEQHALASWLESGHYDRHVRHARRSYAMRRAALSRQLGQRFPGWPQHGTPAGLEILLELPGRLSDGHVAAHARQQGLGVTPLTPMRVRAAGLRAWCSRTPGSPPGAAPTWSAGWNWPCRPSRARSAPFGNSSPRPGSGVAPDLRRLAGGPEDFYD